MKTGRALEFVFFDAGGGHRSAATSLQKVLADYYPSWDVELVNLQDVLRAIDPIHALLSIDSQDVYNKALKKGLTYGGGVILSTLQTGITLYAPVIEKKLREHWRRSSADLVVSLIPNFNRVMFRSLRAVRPQVPYVTIMTDIADHPAHFWQEAQDQYLICGSEMAVRQALAVGYTADRIRQTSGMILKPDFYHRPAVDRTAGRQALGLEADLLTALIMFGGHGSENAIKIVRQLRKAALPVQTIVMCGHNKELLATLQDTPRCHAVGFTEQVANYMALADFFIGKPGPGSISEALHMGLPVIVESGLRTMPQERYNAVWVEENGLGLAVSSFRQIAKTIASLLEGDRLQRFRANALALDNRAVHEIPPMLEEIMEQSLASAA